MVTKPVSGLSPETPAPVPWSKTPQVLRVGVWGEVGPEDSTVLLEVVSNWVILVVKYVDCCPLEVSACNVRVLTGSCLCGGVDNFNRLPFHHQALSSPLRPSTPTPTPAPIPSQRGKEADK